MVMWSMVCAFGEFSEQNLILSDVRFLQRNWIFDISDRISNDPSSYYSNVILKITILNNLNIYHIKQYIKLKCNRQKSDWHSELTKRSDAFSALFPGNFQHFL